MIAMPVADATEIAGIYAASATIDPRVLPSYAALISEINAQYAAIPGRIEFVPFSPYGAASVMFADIVSGRVQIMATNSGDPGDSGHPIFGDRMNDRFRAVHDYYGHFLAGVGFDRDGEHVAWLRHRETFSPLARYALASETRGQNAAMIVSGTFQAQKAIMLPDRYV